jgi:hypothetical protein
VEEDLAIRAIPIMLLRMDSGAEVVDLEEVAIEVFPATITSASIAQRIKKKTMRNKAPNKAPLLLLLVLVSE